ncbi:MAG: hypothetical protein DHS20C15_13580 [Planctomycetota bacterium]|nr:MAG: hypothetical protein DHS20C15_13580 [Planctomycetota bacterium]
MEPRPARERPHGGRGHAYRYVKGRKQVLWRVEGWYAFRVLLSDDGRYLVRLGNWPRGQRPSESHLAVAFYDNGELLAEYSTRALIEDDSKVRPSSSHYTYRAHDGELSLVVGDTEKGELPLSFEFSTIDGIRYRFDVTTGEIVARSPPASEESAGAESPASSDLTPPEREG